MLDSCADTARVGFGLSDLLVLGTVVVVVLVVWEVVRRYWPVNEDDAVPPPPEYAESLKGLELLKSGKPWGDLSQVEPQTGTTNKESGRPCP